MREYLFKAKTMPNGTIGPSRWIESHHIGSVYLKSAFIGGVYCYPESVGEYTEFSTMNDKKIFEKDIIEWAEDRDPETKIWGVVEWNDSMGLWGVINNKTHIYDLLGYVHDRSIAIGNYFDNPELVEEVKEQS